MEQPKNLDEKVYAVDAKNKLSVRNLLDFFTHQGKMRVSDLHLKVGAPPTYRVDGLLDKLKGAPMDDATLRAIVQCLLSPEDLQVLQTNRSINSICTNGKQLFRINVFHESHGMAVALRALEFTPPEVENIGFPNGVWQDIVKLDHGLVIVAGITGAGKSTTITSMISRIAQDDPCRIITLEDPIEYQLKGNAAMISQREIGRDVISFEHGLRDCLREDPDVIFVGEMSDRESAAWTLTAAETGHLVFSTLHTRDVRGTITRLLDLFSSDRQDEIMKQLSLSLAYIICQKLIPRADGTGRIVAMEILNNNYATAHIIRNGKMEQINSVLQTKTRDVRNERMTSMERSMAYLVAKKLITLQDAELYANHPEEIAPLVEHFQKELEPPVTK